jgi:hypothetical protein
MANNIPVTKAWVDNLGQTVREGKDYGQIIGKAPLTPEEYALQNARYDIERGAQMERPTYGMWNGEAFISTDPNEIAEINARSEMRRTGLDRYYRPQSGAYFEAFNKIRDRYLQQELGKKAAVEAEGRAIVANRLGAFDKILQERAEAEKNKGLVELRKAQAREADARAKSYEGDGMTPAQRRQATEQHRHNLIAETNRRITDYEKIEKDFGLLPPEKRPANYSDIVKAKQVAYSTLDYLMSGGDPEKVMFFDTKSVERMTDALGRYKAGSQGSETGLAGVPINPPNIQTPQATNEIIVTGPDGRKYKQVPKSAKTQQGNGMVFQVGETGLGETPEKPKPQSLEDRLLYGRKRNN